MKIRREIECYTTDSDELICSFKLNKFNLDEARCNWDIGNDKLMYEVYEIKEIKQKEFIKNCIKGITINFDNINIQWFLSSFGEE